MSTSPPSQEKQIGAGQADPMPSSKISIIGAGISSLVLARTLLRNHKIKTCIFEKARKSTRRNNYGITLYEQSYKHLLELLEIDRKELESQVGILPAKQRETEDGDSMRVHRGKLERLLMETIEKDIHFETELDSLKTSPGTIDLQFKSNEAGTDPHSTSLLIAADGVHSLVRQTLLPSSELQILPFATYNGKKPLPKNEWQRIQNFFENETVLEHRIGSNLFQVSLCDTPPSSHQEEGEICLSYTFSRPASPSSHQDPLFNPQRSKPEATSSPPEEFFNELSTHTPNLPEPFSQSFEPEMVRRDRLLNWLQRSLHLDIEKLKEKAGKERIVLIGDAGHAEPILGGRGANGAILDAVVLAGVIGRGEGLVRFYELRGEEWSKGAREAEERIGKMHREKEKSSL